MQHETSNMHASDRPVCCCAAAHRRQVCAEQVRQDLQDHQPCGMSMLALPLSIMQAARALSTALASQLAQSDGLLQLKCPPAGRVCHHRDIGGGQGRCRRCGGRSSQGIRQGALAPHVSRCISVLSDFILGTHGVPTTATWMGSGAAIVTGGRSHQTVCDRQCCNRLRHFLCLQDGRAAGAHHQQVRGPAGGQPGGAGAAGDAGDDTLP
jgi:hypothetical protein